MPFITCLSHTVIVSTSDGELQILSFKYINLGLGLGGHEMLVPTASVDTGYEFRDILYVC